ncbi:MAG: OB-fold nucleic acid binding domain-containing protein, partial [Bacteroidota bacterium]
AIKGTGESAVQAVIEERNANGPFQDIFDFAKRVNLRTVNKKSFESLAKAGAFDSFEDYHRRQYVDPDEEGTSVIEKAIRFANRIQEEEASAQSSLFGGASGIDISKPKVGRIEPYGDIEKLNIEKEMVGLFITGHPLNQFKFEMDHLTNANISRLTELEKLKGREVKIGGIVSDVQHRTSKKGNPFGQFTLEDFNDNYTFYLFGQDYLKFKSMLEPGWFLYLTGIVQNRWNSEELELKITNVDHLGEIREKMTKGLELKIRLSDVNESIIQEIERIAASNPGKCLLKMSLSGVYEDRAISLDMLSRKFTIEPTDAFMKQITEIEELRYKVLLSK